MAIRGNTKKTVPLPKLLKKAQVVFNSFVRSRDKDLGCISCGAEVEQAGHYRSQNQYSSLRFNEVNVQGQCIRCNHFLSGNLIDYRIGLVDRYGEQKVLHLESVPGFKKWSRTELEAIIKLYEKKSV